MISEWQQRGTWQARADWVGGWAEATALAKEATMSKKEQRDREAESDRVWWAELIAKAERDALGEDRDRTAHAEMLKDLAEAEGYDRLWKAGAWQ